MIEDIAKERIKKTIKLRNVNDQIFISTQKSGVNIISAKINSYPEFKLIQDYKAKFPHVEVEALQFQMTNIQDTFESNVSTFNKLKLKKLGLIGDDRSESKLTYLAQLVHLQELNLKFSKLTQIFYFPYLNRRLEGNIILYTFKQNQAQLQKKIKVNLNIPFNYNFQMLELLTLIPSLNLRSLTLGQVIESLIYQKLLQFIVSAQDTEKLNLLDFTKNIFRN
eukprot:403354264